jgi:hypothetical protein
MKRIIVLVVVALVMAALLVAAALPVFARTTTIDQTGGCDHQKNVSSHSAQAPAPVATGVGFAAGDNTCDITSQEHLEEEE